MKTRLALVIAFGCIGPALADAPKTSLRPLPRPVLVQAATAVPAPVAEAANTAATIALPDLARRRPLHRPAVKTVAEAAVSPELAAPELAGAELAGAAPPPRKGLLGLIAPRAKPAKRAKASSKGSVCGDPLIKGKDLPRITSRTKGCGVENPVSVTSVDGARLSTPATINCETAVALKTWVQKGLRPAFPSTEVTSLTVVDSYSCRPRNNVHGAKISEHGHGKAIDISGITFANGKSLTVSRNFKALRKAYKAACGIFGTTLGPGSDGYHEDHMHFDTARQRGGGAYCH